MGPLMVLVAGNRWTRVCRFPSDFCRRKLRISRRRENQYNKLIFSFQLTTFQGFNKALYVLGISNINRSVPIERIICIKLLSRPSISLRHVP